MRKQMRLFLLVRSEDISGVSGTGVVAEGVQFSDGTVAMRWLRRPYGVAFYGSIGDVVEVHGHGGRTRVMWLEPDGKRPAGRVEKQEQEKGGVCGAYSQTDDLASLPL